MLPTSYPTEVRRYDASPTVTDELVTWPASRIAPLCHLNDTRPDPALFRPPSMRVQPSAVHPLERRWSGRVFSEPAGGFWTLSWRAGYTADEFIAELFRQHPYLAMRFDVWLLEPDPAARVLVLDSPLAVRAALRRWPYGDGLDLEPDFEAVAAAGFDGVHVPVGAEAGLGAPGMWGPGVTCWLRWVFPRVPALPYWSRRATPGAGTPAALSPR